MQMQHSDDVKVIIATINGLHLIWFALYEPY